MDAAPQSPSNWSAARERFRQLEAAAERMGPVWFAGNAAVSIAAALFLLTAIGLGLGLVRIQGLSDTAALHQSALLHSMRLQETLDEASAAARAFASQHDATMLSVRENAKRAARQSLDQLGLIVRGDDEAEHQVQIVRSVTERRISLFDDLVSQTKTNTSTEDIRKGDALRIRLFRETNAEISAFRARQTAALTTVQDDIRRNLQLALGLVLFAGITAPICGLFGIRLLKQVQSDHRTRELQMELMHVQRLAIMGETSAMLAHEINQPLTAATNYLAVLRRHLETDAIDKALPMAERIQQQIQRAGNILKKLRRFIEKRESERSLEAPEGLIEDALTLVGTIDDSVMLTTMIADGLPRVLVDRVQLQQVLVNLMRNAIEAMQECPRHELVLSVVAKDDAMVEISLADSGPGLPADVAERLFQPFVSTKKNGMGVGLSICRTIVAQHGGRIWADANPEGGTTFRFTLPAAEERIAA